MNFVGATQHRGNNAATNVANYVQKAYFPRDTASLIENLEIKIEAHPWIDEQTEPMATTSFSSKVFSNWCVYPDAPRRISAYLHMREFRLAVRENNKNRFALQRSVPPVKILRTIQA
jgi:hypothetical protein